MVCVWQAAEDDHVRVARSLAPGPVLDLPNPVPPSLLLRLLAADLLQGPRHTQPHFTQYDALPQGDFQVRPTLSLYIRAHMIALISAQFIITYVGCSESF